MNQTIIQEIINHTNTYDKVDLQHYIDNLDLNQLNPKNLISKFVNLFLFYKNQDLPLQKIIKRTYGTLILENYAGDFEWDIYQPL